MHAYAHYRTSAQQPDNCVLKPCAKGKLLQQSRTQKHPSLTNIAKNQWLCAKTQHKCTRMLDSRNKREQSILTLRNNNLVGIEQSFIYIPIYTTSKQYIRSFSGAASLNDHTMCHVGKVQHDNQHT